MADPLFHPHAHQPKDDPALGERYLAGGAKLEALSPQGRDDAGQPRAVDEETGLALLALRRERPKQPVTTILEILNKRQCSAGLGKAPSLSTVYRFLHQHGLMGALGSGPEDRRKFEAELPNDLWQADVMHGPLVRMGEGDKRRKSYLIAFLDDHSRLVPHAAFYPSESLLHFLEAFSRALLKRGLPRKLYVDNGSAFRSRQLEYTSAALGIALVHARPYRPQGKGKIERFFKPVQTQMLPGFAGESLEELNCAFEHWLTDVYHSRVHSSTGQSPFERFTSRMEWLRAAPADLRDYFRKSVRRRVNNDRSVVVDKRLFEAPVELIGKQVEVLYHPESPELVEIRCGQASWGFHRAIDFHVNSRVARTRDGTLAVSCDPTACNGGKLWEAD
jgi:putative transposase